ncbi:hypothetical protein [Methylobacterium sp. CM6257]|jgi:hypothetical protein
MDGSRERALGALPQHRGELPAEPVAEAKAQFAVIFGERSTQAMAA